MGDNRVAHRYVFRMRIFLICSAWLACSPEPEPCTDVGIELGQCAPKLTLPRASGGDWSLADQTGKVVLVQLAAAWCGVCQSLAEEQQALVDDLSDQGFTKVTVLKGDLHYESVDQAEALEWKTYFELSHPVLFDEQRTVWRRWKQDTNDVPQQYLIDRKGAIRWRKVGSEDAATLREEIQIHLDFRD